MGTLFEKTSPNSFESCHGGETLLHRKKLGPLENLRCTKRDLQEAIKRDGFVQVPVCGYNQSLVHPGLYDRGLEGDMGEGRPHLLFPHFPLFTACR